MQTSRYAARFESIDGSQVYTFPLDEYEYQPSSPVRTAFSEGVGLTGSFDHLLLGKPVRSLRQDTIRFIILENTGEEVDDAIDDMKSKLYGIGLGKLVTIGSDLSERWAYSRIVDIPEPVLMNRRPLVRAVELTYATQPPWYGVLVEDVETVTVSGHTWIVNNPGNVDADLVTVRMRSNSAAGFTNPRLRNVDNGYIIQSMRDAVSINSELRFNPNTPAIEWSDNNGSSYVDDVANYVEQATQPYLSFRMKPGDNTLEFVSSGVVNVDIETSFYATFL